VTRSQTSCTLVVALGLLLATPAAARAQSDDPATLKLAEPDFTLITLPTSLRLPTFGSAFRVTHRFGRPLGQGSFGDLVGDLFGIDNGAQIGLEYRFGIVKNGQIGINRTSNKTIEFFGQYDIIRQDTRLPVEVSALATIEGTNNFRDSYTPGLGIIVSRTIRNEAAFYVEPMWMNNTNPLPRQVVDHNDTFMVGLGTRIRVRPTVYIVAEVIPRAAGYKPGGNQGSVAVEKRVGGHSFQLNFSNNLGTTMGQIARGGSGTNDWFMGFNISRKFF
jgi:hypothetical protein